MRLLLRFGIPQTDNTDASAQATAENFAEKQYFLPGYEVRRAKRAEYLAQGQPFVRYEVWGEYDVKAMSAEVERRLVEEGQKPIKDTAKLELDSFIQAVKRTPLKNSGEV